MKDFIFNFAQEDLPSASGHVFLVQAVHDIGGAMFGAQWTGKEPLHDPRPSAEMRIRFSAVKKKIAELAADGHLKTATRPVTGGETYPLKPSVWQTERLVLDLRFTRCQIDLSDPFITNHYREGRGPDYIFVTRESLDHALRTLVGESALPTVATYRTGVAGRPSSMDLILPEAKRRVSAAIADNTPAPSKAAFARELIAWLETTYPEAVRPKQKALTNNPEFTTLVNDWKRAAVDATQKVAAGPPKTTA